MKTEKYLTNITNSFKTPFPLQAVKQRVGFSGRRQSGGGGEGGRTSLFGKIMLIAQVAATSLRGAIG